MCWRCELLRAGFPLRSPAGPPFPVVPGLPRLFGVGCSGIAARCGVGRRGELVSGGAGLGPLRRVLLRGINGHAAGG